MDTGAVWWPSGRRASVALPVGYDARMDNRSASAVSMTAIGLLGAFVFGGARAGAAAGRAPAMAARDAGSTDCALWRGKVGGRQVAVTLHAVPGANALNGRYTYLHIGKPIPLVGARNETGLSVEERGGPDGTPTGRWTLSSAEHGSDRLTGTWSAPGGKRTVPIDLVCLADGAGRLRQPWYDAVPAGGTTDEQFDAFVRYPEVTDNVEDRAEGTSVRQAALASAGDRYELVDRHPSRKAALAVNAAIRARVALARKEERECLADGRLCEITANVRIAFLSPRFATVDVRGNYDAGGAHPDTDTEVWAFEMADDGAKRLKVERFYELKGRGGRVKPAFWKVVRAAAHKKVAGAAADPSLEDCPDGKDDGKIQLGIAEGGIDVDVSFTSHAIAACGYSVFVKAAELAPFLHAGAPEAFRTGNF